MSTAARPGSPRAGRLTRVVPRRPETGLVGLIVVMTVLAALVMADFRTARNFNEMANDAAQIAVLAVGEAVVILARQIDLSVGAILGLSAYLVGSAVGHLSGPLSPILGTVMALGLGAALGLGNAWLVDQMRMPAIIATLATLSIYSGLQIVVTGGSELYVSQVPAWLANLRSASWFGVGPFIWIAFISLVVVSFLMRRTRFGRDVYAMGSNPEAARYLGIRFKLRTYEAFALCGALAGLGGLLYTSAYGNVDATAGNGMELTVIATAVIGGVSLFGGSGTPFGAVLGAVLLIEIETVLALLKISIFAEQTLEGAAIVLAVAIYAVASRRLRRPVRREQAGSEEEESSPARGAVLVTSPPRAAGSALDGLATDQISNA